MKLRRGAFGLIVLLILCQASFAVGRRVGEVVEVVGRVTLTREGVTVALERGAAILVGDILETTRNSNVEIKLGTGHHVRLRANSRIRVSTTASSYDIDTYYGGVLAAINSGATDGQGFRVTTPSATGAVRGTLFSAEVEESGDSTYMVLHGTVEAVQLESGESSLVGESTKCVVPVVGEAVTVAMTEEEITELTAWAAGLLGLPGVVLGGAADSALGTLTEGLQPTTVGATPAGGFPWAIVGAVGVVGATAIIVAAGQETSPEEDERSAIRVNVEW